MKTGSTGHNVQVSEIDEAFSSARQKVSEIFGMEQSHPKVGSDPRAVFFQFKDHSDVISYKKEGDLQNNLKNHDWFAAQIASDQDDIHMIVPFPEDFFENPNKALDELYKAAKESGRANDVRPEDVRLTDAEAEAIKSSRGRGIMAELKARYEGKQINKEMGTNLSTDVAASVFEVKQYSYKELNNKEAVALGETKNALDAIVGKWGSASVEYTARYDFEYIGQSAAEADSLYNDLTKNLHQDKANWPMAITRVRPTVGQSYELVSIRPNPARESEFYKDPNAVLAEFSNLSGAKGNYDPAIHKISAQSTEALGRLKEKVAVGEFMRESGMQLYDGAKPEYLEKLKKTIGIESQTEYPENTEGIGPRQLSELFRNISVASADGFDEKEKSDIDSRIKELAEKMKGKIQDADYITLADKAAAEENLDVIKKNMEKQIDKKSPSPER